MRAGIIGLGRIAVQFSYDPTRPKPASHIEAYKANPNIELVAVCDSNGVRAQEVATVWKVPKAYDTLAAMLRHEKLDVLSVCTPASEHFDNVLTAISFGVSRIWLEKPMALTTEQAKMLLDTIEKNHVRVIVNFNRRWDYRWKNLHQLTEGLIWKNLLQITEGKIHSFHGTFSGDLREVGVHMADIANWFGLRDHPDAFTIERSKSKEVVFKVEIVLKDGTVLELFQNGRRLKVGDDDSVVHECPSTFSLALEELLGDGPVSSGPLEGYEAMKTLDRIVKKNTPFDLDPTVWLWRIVFQVWRELKTRWRLRK